MANPDAFGTFNLADSMGSGLKLRALQDQLRDGREDRAREAERRTRLSDFLLAQGGQKVRGHPSTPAGMEAVVPPSSAPRLADMAQPAMGRPSMGQPPGNAMPQPAQAPAEQGTGLPGVAEIRRSAWEALVRADPDGALKIRKAQFDNMKDEVELIGTLAMTATDQATYDQSLQRAASYGLDISELPREYNPEVIDAFRMQAAGAAQALASIAKDKRLQWDMEDDLADNERADRNLESLEEYREGQLDNTRRGQDLTDARGRRGQDMTDSRVRHGQDRRGSTGGGGGSKEPNSEGALYARIMDKWRSGGEVNGREREFVRAYEARRAKPAGSGRGRGGGARSRDGAVIVNPQTGQRMVLQGGKWVPAK